MKKERKEREIAKTSNGNEQLLHASAMGVEELLQEYKNTLNGYTEEQVDDMRREYGWNVIKQQRKESVLKRLIKSFINPFTVVLFVLAFISLFTDVIFPQSGKSDPTAVIIVIVMVSISGILNFVQETKSSNAAENLKSMIKTTICVVRAEVGKIEVPIDEVVVGDVICLAAGDMIPADVRIISCKDLFVSQSALTGESNPIEKVGTAQEFTHKNSLELSNLAFMGSNVVSGSAMCIAIAIGDDTHFGAIAKTLTKKKVVTSFEKGVNSVSWLLIRFMFIMVPIVFFVIGIRTHSWLDALLFGLSVAVGLTPEMLPMIVTTGLAKGAVKLSKKKTVVKNLNSIQNFGAIDVLCTDKTGTLTLDEIILERYLDIHGNEDPRILRHAFLNSHFQTGMKNLMDIAILNHGKEKGIVKLEKKYIKVDEIPFDFTRRRMSVVIRDTIGKTQLITKGATEEMLAICSHAEFNGVVPLTDEIKAEILKTVDKLNSGGMRVLAVAQKNNPPVEGLFSIKDESDMVLIGYLAFLDPPKASAKAAIKALNEYGVDVKVLTGDSLNVTKCVCRKVGVSTDRVLVGNEVEAMTDEELKIAVEEISIFAKLTPQQKVRIVQSLRDNGHVVGFMGDGINDAAAIRQADVGISVDSAVDIAKESADIILLEKDLMVLERGIIEGRKTFANIVKYIKLTASSNFGNMFAVLVASVMLPFLPMLPLQILALNLIYDISCISIPWDKVDPEFLQKPKKWNASSIGKFMVWIGPASSVFDITTFFLMYYLICPQAVGGQYTTLNTDQQLKFMMLFQAGWFIESLWTQTLVIHLIRTAKLPFVKSRASWQVFIFTSTAIALGTIIPFTAFGEMLGMAELPPIFFAYLAGTIVGYMLLMTLIKMLYVKRYKELL